MAVIEIDVQDFLPLGHGDVHTPTGHSVNQWFPITQVARTSLTVETISHFYSPDQVVEVQRSIRVLGISDYLFMYDKGAKTAAVEYPIDIFFMWHEAKVVEYEIVEQSFVLTQTVSYHRTKAATSTLTFTQSATYTSIRPRELVDSFSMSSNASVYTNDKYRYSIPLPTLTGPNAPEC